MVSRNVVNKTRYSNILLGHEPPYLAGIPLPTVILTDQPHSLPGPLPDSEDKVRSKYVTGTNLNLVLRAARDLQDMKSERTDPVFRWVSQSRCMLLS